MADRHFLTLHLTAVSLSPIKGELVATVTSIPSLFSGNGPREEKAVMVRVWGGMKLQERSLAAEHFIIYIYIYIYIDSL